MKSIIIGALYAICFMSEMWLIDQFMVMNYFRHLAIGILFLALYTIHRGFIQKS